MLHRSIRRYAFAALVSCAALPFAAQAGALTDILMAKLAVTQPQADGGAGSIFKLARAQMTPENFQKLNAVVPGIQGGQFDAEFRGRSPKERDQLVTAMKDKVTVQEGQIWVGDGSTSVQIEPITWK